MRAFRRLCPLLVTSLLALGGCAGDRDAPAVEPRATVAASGPAEVGPVAVAVDPAAVPPSANAPATLPAPASPGLVAVAPVGAIDLLQDVKGSRDPAVVVEGAPSASAPPPLADDGVAAALAATRPAGTEIGYLLIDLASGQSMAELNADLPLIPASTTKLATAVIALDLLGPEYRFRTRLRATGRVRDGVLLGDLILEGGGDPALDLADLLGLAVRLEASGTRQVAGRLLVDDSALPRLTEIEPSQPLEAAYNPGIGALSLAFNRVRVSWDGGDPRDALILPPLDEARFEAAAASRLPPGGVELGSATDEAVVWRVALRAGREFSLPVKDPGLHAGQVFALLARAQGITLGDPERGLAPATARLVAVHESAPLRHLLRDMLVYSNNMMAEMIGLAAAQRLGNVVTGLDAAGDLMVRHLARLVPEVTWDDAVLGNHSGLDGNARLTPRQLAAIARYGWERDALPALLAGGGWSGTLAHRFDERDTALRVWAKTGAVNYGNALAGYLFPASNRPAVFVTMVSDLDARASYDALERPDGAAEATAKRWNRRARALQDDLVETWLLPLPTS